MTGRNRWPHGRWEELSAPSAVQDRKYRSREDRNRRAEHLRDGPGRAPVTTCTRSAGQLAVQGDAEGELVRGVHSGSYVNAELTMRLANRDPQNTRTDAELLDALRRAWLLPKEGIAVDPTTEAKFSLDSAVNDEGMSQVSALSFAVGAHPSDCGTQGRTTARVRSSCSRFAGRW